MATIRFFLQSSKNPATIYVRVSTGSKSVFKRRTGYIIDPENWNLESHLPKKGGEVAQKNLKTNLQKLATTIETNLNESISKGIEVTGEWLQRQIDEFNGKVILTEKDNLVNCIQDYIDYLPRKKHGRGKRGVAITTIKKYKSVLVKIKQFEVYRKKAVAVKDVGLKLIEELETYFLDVDRLNGNTTGRYIKAVKTVCLWAAYENEIAIHPQLKQVKGYRDEVAKVFLTLEELEQVEKTTYEREALENAKDWLIIGCFVGQRVSDLLKLTEENLSFKNGRERIELTQEKTKKRVAIPMHPKIKTILEKRKGKFPYPISDVKFNLHIKEVCRLAGINQLVDGGKMVTNDVTKMTRKEHGRFPKHELISSHVCRRSYATNFYGEMPTSWLISITAHATERQFLEYVGKSELDTADQIADCYDRLALQAKKESHTTILKTA